MSLNPERCGLAEGSLSETAKLRFRDDCIFCAVDFGSLRKCAGQPVAQADREQRRQAAEVARRIISFDPEMLIVVQDPTLFDPCLTQVLDCVYREHPVSLHRTGGLSPDYARFAEELTACGAATLLADADRAERSLLQRMRWINRIDARIAAAVAARLASSVSTAALQAAADAVARISTVARRTIVLGEWAELAILRFWLKDWIGPDETIATFGEADSYI